MLTLYWREKIPDLGNRGAEVLKQVLTAQAPHIFYHYPGSI